MDHAHSITAMHQSYLFKLKQQLVDNNQHPCRGNEKKMKKLADEIGQEVPWLVSEECNWRASYPGLF
jgi:hypothetical protein